MPVTAPQLATLVERPPDGAGWLHELKHDGYRFLIRRAGERVQIFSRNGNDWTKRFPFLVTAASKLKSDNFTIDGEACVLNEKGVSNVSRLQDAIARGDDSIICYFAFDCIRVDGEDTASLPLIDRKERLKRLLVSRSRRIVFSDHVEGDGTKVLEHACKMGHEGIVSKRKDSPYRAGRNLDWQKSKCFKRQEFIVIGFFERSTDPKDLGALALGAYEKGKLVYVGHVGTGRNAETRRSLNDKLRKLEIKNSAIELPRGVSRSGFHLVRLNFVAEVTFLEWTNDGFIRHPSFQGLREDKTLKQVVIERLASVPGLIGGSHWERQPRRQNGRRR